MSDKIIIIIIIIIIQFNNNNEQRSEIPTGELMAASREGLAE
jgi:hypothetical protein